jgi:DNA-binding transcriptional ArsR family regulator
MAIQAGFSQVAAALADPAREAMLGALVDGRALPAGELAAIAGVSPQSASGHLQKLVDCGVLAVWAQGKFRYYRLAGENAAEVIAALANFAHGKPSRSGRRPVPQDLGFARCCYTHLAGTLGVSLADLLRRRGYIRIAGDHVELTDAGRRWAIDNGFLPAGKRASRPDLRLCLDWTERRHHLAGRVPSAILQHLLERGHLRRGVERSLKLTPSGEAWFAALGRSGRYQSET